MSGLGATQIAIVAGGMYGDHGRNWHSSVSSPARLA